MTRDLNATILFSLAEMIAVGYILLAVGPLP